LIGCFCSIYDRDAPNIENIPKLTPMARFPNRTGSYAKSWMISKPSCLPFRFPGPVGSVSQPNRLLRGNLEDFKNPL